VALALAVLLLMPVVVVRIASYFVDVPVELREGHAGSVRVLDREGHLLREARPKDGAKTAWVSRDQASLVADALVATEDKRFRSHGGVDWFAVVRAAWSNVAHERTVSGASTITMQLARAVRPHPRTLRGKILEAALATRIEREMSKDEILEAYLNWVEFGPNLRGVGAASRAYFDKPASALSLGEAALLAGMVRGPSYYDLAKRPEQAEGRRKLVLARMVAADVAAPEQAKDAEAEPVILQQRAPAFGAPHFVRALLAGDLGVSPDAAGGTVTTTLDVDLQRAAELATQHVIGSLGDKHVTAASVVVLDNATGDILAYVGSPDFFDEGRAGQNDGALARRQPGSTLKPFVYELAMERLGMTPASVLPDIELHLPTPTGDFSPRDYDESFHGPVRMREALGNSLNVPAVFVADQLGPRAVLERLRLLGLSLDGSAEQYGAAIALGDGEVSLLELAGAYATLARGGTKRAPRAVLGVDVAGKRTTTEPADETRVMPELAAMRVTDMLKDKKARVASFGEGSVLEFSFEAAGKTGTSKGYRDNWTVGYTPQVTVAAWVGNFDGSSMDHVSGITGAGPLFHEVMVAAMGSREKLPLAIDASAPPDALERVEICTLSGARVTPACPTHVFEWFTHDEAASLGFDEMHERVDIDPHNGLRAGHAASATCERVTRTFERFPPRYASWATAANRTLAPDEFSPDCPPDASDTVTGGGALAIRYPLDDAKFVIDPDRAKGTQVLAVSVVAPTSTAEVSLLVDGSEVDRKRTPYTLRWPLAPGDHDLVARVGSVESSRTHIHVRN
jgi:penicillin-binding protein 1C